MKLKRFFTLLVTAVMLLGLMGIFASCGNGGTVKAEVIDGKYVPSVTVTWAWPCIGSSMAELERHTDKDGNFDWTPGDTSWTKYAKENYGINLKLEWDIFDYGAFIGKLNNSILIGEIPDFLNVGIGDYAIDFIGKLYETDLIQPIGDEIMEYACSEYMDTVEHVGEQVFYSSTFNGEIYALPHIVIDNGNNMFWWIRKDWLEAVNKTTPTSYEELIDVFKAFAYQDPDGNGQDDTYGLTMNLENAGAGSSLFFNLFGAFPNYWIEKDGKLVYGSVQPEMKTAISELRDLYTSGVIYSLDEEAGALTSGYGHGITNNKAGAVEQGRGTSPFNSVKQKNPSFDLIPVALTFTATGDEPVLSATAATFRQYVVSKECKYPAVPVLLMNMFCEIELAGLDNPEIQTEYMYSADATSHFYNFAPCITQTIGNSRLEMTKRICEALETGDTAGLGLGQDMQAYNYVTDYLENGDINGWSYERIYSPEGSMKQYIDNPVKEIRNLYQGAKTVNMLDHEPDLIANLTTAIILIVIGEADLNTFDIAVEAWYDGGGTEITAEVNEWYNGVKG